MRSTIPIEDASTEQRNSSVGCLPLKKAVHSVGTGSRICKLTTQRGATSGANQAVMKAMITAMLLPPTAPALELSQESSHRVKSWGPQNDPWTLSRDRDRFARTSTPTNTNLVLSISGYLSPNGQRQKLILKRGSPLIMGKPGAWRPVINCAQPGAN